MTELDYSDYLSESSPSISGSTKDLLDRALWKYSSVLMAQPFDAAKTILQAYVVQGDEQEGDIVPEEKLQRDHRFGGDNYYDDVCLTPLSLLYYPDTDNVCAAVDGVFGRRAQLLHVFNASKPVTFKIRASSPSPAASYNGEEWLYPAHIDAAT